MTRLPLVVVLALAACHATTTPAPPAAAITLATGGVIWTGDPAHPRATAIAWQGDHVLAVGDDTTVTAAAGPRAQRIDLAGRLVTPGFVDAHIHIMGGGLSLDRLDLNPYKTKKDILAAVRAYADAHPDRAWILGRGWSYQPFAPDLPTAAELDAVISERPVWLRSYDGHTGWANSKAMALAKATGNGSFKEDDMDSVARAVPSPSTEERTAALKAAFVLAASKGLTTLCEVGGALEDLDVYQALDDAKALPLRVVYGPAYDDGVPAAAARFEKLAPPTPASRLRAGPLKLFIDGVVESNTAGLLAPYADGSGSGKPPVFDRATVEKQIRDALASGQEVAYHAIGDASVRTILDAVAAIGTPARGHVRIEHLEVIDAADVARFAQLGVTASMMPIHSDPGDEPDGGVWSTKVGAARLKLAFAFKTMHDAGALLAFGSDWPVTPLDPLPALAVAATRQSANGKPPGGWITNQALPLEDALAHYTRESARALHLEADVGVLAAGKQADLVILAPGVTLDDATTFREAKVDVTVAAGTIVYRRQ